MSSEIVTLDVFRRVLQDQPITTTEISVLSEAWKSGSTPEREALIAELHQRGIGERDVTFTVEELVDKAGVLGIDYDPATKQLLDSNKDFPLTLPGQSLTNLSIEKARTLMIQQTLGLVAALGGRHVSRAQLGERV